MDFENYFNSLDTLQGKKEKDNKSKKTDCCDNIKNHIHDDGMTLCKICSAEITNIINNPEWRYYGYNDSKNKDPTRCGMPENVLLPKSSLGTSITYGKRDETSQKINMLQQWNSMPYAERSLYKVFDKIQTVCSSNNLPEKICMTAKSLYSIIAKTKISRGNNRIGIIAACVYHACKECDVPRSVNELSHMFSIGSKIMTKGCKNYTEIIRMSKIDKKRMFQIKEVNLYDFIDRFSSRLELNENEIKKIHKIALICDKEKIISDNTPPSMASGCIYLYCKLKNNKITKKDISDICKISEVTINKCFKKLESNTIIYNKVKELILE